MKKVAFGSVLYKEGLQYEDQFVKSLNEQTTSSFDLIFINDNLNDIEIQKLLGKLKHNVKYKNSPTNSSIPSLRLNLIKYAKNSGYDYLIMGDFDDCFSNNRIDEYLQQMEKNYTFFYNEIRELDAKQLFFNYMPGTVDSINYILESNFLGLSNTALNLHKIGDKELAVLEKHLTPIFDWMLYSVLLLNTHKGKKITDCSTYYRIHNNNLAGRNLNSIKELKKEIDVKINHYYELLNHGSTFYYLYNYFKNLQTKSDSFIKDLANDKNDYNYWWGNIKILKEREN